MQWEEEKPKCPACGVEPAPKAEECAACGVVFAKWKKKMANELPPSDRQLGAPPPVVVREKDQAATMAGRLVGAGLLCAGASLGVWLLYGGSSARPSAGSTTDAVHGVAIAAPAGWNDAPVSPCGKPSEPCTLRFWQRAEPAKDRFPESIVLRSVPRDWPAPGGGALEEELRREIAELIGDGEQEPAKRPAVDGVAGLRLEGRGRKHFKIETKAAENISVAAALAQQRAANPNQGVYSVMATVDYRNPSGGYVKLKDAEYAEFDARPVVGRVAVPGRDATFILAWQYDESDDAAVSGAVPEALASLRVQKRARGMDRLGGALSFAGFGLAAALTFTGLKAFTA